MGWAILTRFNLGRDEISWRLSLSTTVVPIQDEKHISPERVS